VIGITKAYATRVGGGPFPTELMDEMGDRIRKMGGEFGATTGRPRRCGWFDAVVVRQSARLSGMTGLVITKLDVLDGIDPIRICVGYSCEGKKYDLVPSGLRELEGCLPVYEDHPGWSRPTAGCREWDELPGEARSYIRRIEDLTGVKAAAVSTGQERSEHIELFDPFKISSHSD